MTEEQKARWLEMATENGTNRQPAVFKKTPSPPPEFIFTENQYFNLCATVAREAKREAMEEMREPLIDVLVHLVGAHSLLSRSPKKAAPSDKMFDQMLADYGRSIERGRAAIDEIDRRLAEGETT